MYHGDFLPLNQFCFVTKHEKFYQKILQHICVFCRISKWKVLKKIPLNVLILTMHDFQNDLKSMVLVTAFSNSQMLGTVQTN